MQQYQQTISSLQDEIHRIDIIFDKIIIIKMRSLSDEMYMIHVIIDVILAIMINVNLYRILIQYFYI